MKHRFTKFWALLLAFALFFVLAAGCSGSAQTTQTPAETEAPTAQIPSQVPEETETPVPEETEVPEETSGFYVYDLPITTEDVSYTFMLGFNPGVQNYCDGYGSTSVMKEWQARTGITIDFINLSPDAVSNNFQIALAADELPDIVNNGINHYGPGADASVEDGVFLNLMDYAEYLPNYMYLMDSSDLLRRFVTTDSGYASAFYHISKNIHMTQGMVMRADWLDALGMEVPETYDEIAEALRGFKSEMGATEPMMLNASGAWLGGAFSAGYGINAYLATVPTVQLPLYVEDGQVKFTPIEDAYFDYLTMLNEWYSEGLISENMPSIGAFNLYTTEVVTDVTGYFFTDAANIEAYKTTAEDPDFELVALGTPLRNEGDDPYVFGTLTFEFDGVRCGVANSTHSISAKCENVEILLQAFDYLYSEEGSFLCNWGIEGEAYEMVDGKPVFTDLITNNPQGISSENAVYIYACQYGTFVEDKIRYMQSYTPAQQAAVDVWNADTGGEVRTFPVDNVTLTAEEGDEFRQIFGDMSTYISENLLKFVTGELPMTEFEAFRSQLLEMGAERLVEIYQAAYERFMNR